jgi:hypothetical protein
VEAEEEEVKEEAEEEEEEEVAAEEEEEVEEEEEAEEWYNWPGQKTGYAGYYRKNSNRPFRNRLS